MEERARPEAGDDAAWRRCPGCGEPAYRRLVERHAQVCPGCGHHFRLPVGRRLALVVDRGSFVERDAGVPAADPIGFRDRVPYRDRLAAARRLPLVVFSASGGARMQEGIFSLLQMAKVTAALARGFAGPRAIEQTIAQRLPDGFQRAEFLLRKGLIDRIVPRAELRPTLARLLDLLAGPAMTATRRRRRPPRRAR